MTHMEQAMMIASLIGHNDRIKCGYNVPQIDECNAALKRGLLCMIEVHGLQSELLDAIAGAEPAMDGMAEIGGLLQTHRDLVPAYYGGHAWPRCADPYAEALKEAMRCIYQWANGFSPKKG